eukprot:5498390-Amphidinium_carterae.1
MVGRPVGSNRTSTQCRRTCRTGGGSNTERFETEHFDPGRSFVQFLWFFGAEAKGRRRRRCAARAWYSEGGQCPDRRQATCYRYS